MNAAEMIKRANELPEIISGALSGFGGFLRCEQCGNTGLLNGGLAGKYTANGWPRCCGYTMRWWTQRQIDAGEVPTLGGSS